MANANSTTPLFPAPPETPGKPPQAPKPAQPQAPRPLTIPGPPPRLGPPAGHSDLLVAFLKVSLTAVGRAAKHVNCPDVRHLVEQARWNLASAHDLIQTDRAWVA